MTLEAWHLRDAAIEEPDFCPKCGAVFIPFLRGQVLRPKRRWWIFGRVRPYCALICDACKDIIGHELPPKHRIR